MRLLLLLVFIFPLQALAELPEDEKLMRVVVELEELHKVTRLVSEHAREDAPRPFPYGALLVEISSVRSAILRHVQRPSMILKNKKEHLVLPVEVTLTAQEKTELRKVVNQFDSVLSVLPSDVESEGNFKFNYPALESDLLQLKQYVWEVVATSDVAPRALLTIPE